MVINRSGIQLRSALFILLFLLSTVPLYATKGFQTGPPEYQVGIGPFYSAAADLRGTGRKDLIVANSAVSNGLGTSTTISVLLSNPDGTYQAAVPYTVGNNPIGIAVGDFNKDGKLDLAVANAKDGTISILLGNGNGTFQPATTISSGGPTPVGVFTADLRGVGKLDLVVTNSDFIGADSCASSNVSVLLGNGNGTFGTPAKVASGGCPFDGAIANLGSGHLDFIYVITGGMNANTAESIGVLLGNGSGGFASAVTYAVGTRPQNMAVADFNGDGKLDVVVADKGDKNTNANGGVSLLLGNGNGTFQPATFVSGITQARNIAAGDFNSDNKADIAITVNNNGGKNVQVLLGNGNGTFQSPLSTALTGANSDGQLLAADLNGDGKLDLAALLDNTPNPGDVTVLLGNGDGTFAGTITSYSFGNYSAQALTTSDFNNDGKADLAVAITNFQNGCSPSCTDAYDILTGLGNGKFTQLASVGLPFGNATGIVAGLFNNSSANEDLVVSQNGGGSTPGFSYLAGNGDGTFGSPSNSTGVTPFQVTAADLNGDGKLDLVMGICAPVETILGNGDGTFGSFTQLSQQAGVGIYCVSGQVAVGSLGGVGSTPASPSDIVAVVPDASNTNINAYVYLNQGGGTYGSPLVYQIGTSTTNCNGCRMGAAVGHFVEATNSAFQDIAVTNAVNNTVTILKNNANGTFTIGNIYSVGTDPDFIGVGDFNGDGHLDLAVANCGNCNMSNGAGSNISILYGNGDGTFQAPTAATTYVAGNGSISIAVGDYNGDAAPDLAVVNGNDGTVTILLNTGGTFASLQSSLNPAQFGQSVTFTATFTPSLSNTATTGTVTFYDGNTAISGAINISGNQAQFMINTLGSGTHMITARYSGDSNYNAHTSAALSQVIGKGASATALSAAPNPAGINQPVTLTATATGGGATPTGQVTFMDGASTIPGSPVTLNGSGVATLSPSFASAGTHSLTAVYAGDTNYTGNTSNTVSEVVRLAPTTTTVSSGTNPGTQAVPVTFTATVTTGFGKPAGTVNFTATGPSAVTPSNGNSLNVSGMATGSLTFPVAGSYSVTATYNGDSDHAGSASSPLTEIVNCVGCIATTTTIQSPVTVAPPRNGERPNTVELLQTTTFKVTVTATSGVAAPTGTIQLQENGVTLGSGTLGNPSGTSAAAMITVSHLNVGDHNVVAIYSGAAGFDPSASVNLQVLFTPKPH